MKKYLLLSLISFFFINATKAQEIPDEVWEAYETAEEYTAQGKYSQAIKYYLTAIDGYESYFGKDANYATLTNNLAGLYESQGLYEKAEPLYIEAKNIDEEVLGNKHPNYATSCNNLAFLYDSQGLYEKAEPLYIEAKNIYEEVLGNKHPNYAQSCNNLAGLYESQGLYEKAEPLYIEAKNVREEVLGNKHPDYAQSCNNLAYLYNAQGLYEKAESLYLEAKNIREEVLGNKHPDYAQSCNNLAYLYNAQGLYEKAEPLYLEAKNIYEEVLDNKHPSYATSCNNLALLYSSQGFYEKAEPLYIEAKNIYEEVLSNKHPSYATSCNNLAQLYRSQGLYKKAESLYLEAVQNKVAQIENLLPTLSEKERKSYVESIQFYFENFYIFALQYHPQKPAVATDLMNLQLILKGLLFSSTQKVQNQILNSGDATLITKYQDWKAKRGTLAKVIQMSLAEKEQAGIEEEALQAEAEALEKELSLAAKDLSGFGNLTGLSELTWQDLQKDLKDEEALIELIRINTGGELEQETVYAALIITSKTKKQPELLILDTEVQMEMNGDMRTFNIEDGTAGGGLYFYQSQIRGRRTDKLSYSLYWQPIQDKLEELGNFEKIYLSRDGVYHSINLNTLYNPNTEKYLGEEKEIILVNSWQNFVASKEQDNAKAGKGYVLLGYADFENAEKEAAQITEYSTYIPDTIKTQVRDYFEGQKISILAGTKTEVESIATQLQVQNKEVALYESENASENLVKSLNSPQILHIATHGFFIANLPDPEKKDLSVSEQENDYKLTENPLLRSGLILAGASNPQTEALTGEDGVLTAEEAMNLYLDNTELVVMSACETGKGEVANGEGVYGLQRAFQQAGAKNILMSLWKVDDTATQKLMTYFYEEYLSNGEQIRPAFQAAQSKLKAEYPEPYYWGAFVLIGE